LLFSSREIFISRPQSLPGPLRKKPKIKTEPKESIPTAKSGILSILFINSRSKKNPKKKRKTRRDEKEKRKTAT